MKRLLCVLLVLLTCAFVSVTCFATGYYRLIDDADILSDSEEDAVIERLTEISERYRFDLAIVTIESLEGEDLEDTANTLYDELLYGYGATDGGMLLLLVMDTRDWTVSKNGFGLTAFTDAGVEYIMDKIMDDLGNDRYASAFEAYVDLCDDFLAQAKAGNPYTVDTLPKDPFNFGMSLIISVVIGFVVALIVTGVMKGKLKSVRSRAEASDYTRNGSFNVTEARDFFLYRTVMRREKPKSNSGSGRSSGGGSSRNVSGKF